MSTDPVRPAGGQSNHVSAVIGVRHHADNISGNLFNASFQRRHQESPPCFRFHLKTTPKRLSRPILPECRTGKLVNIVVAKPQPNRLRFSLISNRIQEKKASLTPPWPPFGHSHYFLLKG